MARNFSYYLDQITNLHKSSIEKENSYVMNNILNSDCIEFRMKGLKPMGMSASGEIESMDIDQTFETIGDIFKEFGGIDNTEYKHPVEYFINLVKFCKKNNILFEGYNKHTNTQIPLSLDDIYNAMDNETIDEIYPGVTDEVKTLARENHSCYYGVDMLINEYNQMNNAKSEENRETPLYKKDVDALRCNLELDFYNKKVEEWNNLHQMAVNNNISSTTTNKAFAVRAYGNGAKTQQSAAEVFENKKIKSGKAKTTVGDVLKNAANAYKNLKNEDKILTPDGE